MPGGATPSLVRSWPGILSGIEFLEDRSVPTATVTGVVNSLTRAATGSLAGTNELALAISGSNFLNNPQGQANNVFMTDVSGNIQFAVNNFTINSDTEIVANYPAHGVGTFYVRVNTPDGISPTQSRFDYMAPVVTSVSPNSGALSGKTNVVLTGQYFTGASLVQFGSTGPGVSGSSLTVQSDSKISLVTPVSTAGTVDLLVSVNGTSSTPNPPGDQFTYIGPPVVSSLSASTGPNAGGTPVTISGSGFTGSTLMFGKQVLTLNQAGPLESGQYQIASDTQINALSPSGQGTVDVVVSNSAGQSTISGLDQFSYATLPLIFNIPADMASQGVYLTMFGTIEEDYTNTFGINLPSGTNVFLVKTSTGYDYVPDSYLLGSGSNVPPFAFTTSAQTNFAVDIPNVQVQANRVIVGVGGVTNLSNSVSLPTGTLTVGSTAGFNSSGNLTVVTGQGTVATLAYTGITPTSFTGVTGGTGTLPKGTVIRGTAVAPVKTTLAPSSNGQDLPVSTINVVSTTGFPASGTLIIQTSKGVSQVAYTGLTSTSFTGCSGGAGTLSTGATVSYFVLPTPEINGSKTTVALSSNNQALPQATINVESTVGFPSPSGSFLLQTASGLSIINYTGTTATSFTGCTGGLGTLATGDTVNTFNVAAPTPELEGSNIYDFFEFSYLPVPAAPGGELTLTINTSAIDQFGIPITLDIGGGIVQPGNQVGVYLNRQDILGIPGVSQGLFSQFLGTAPGGSAYKELTQDAFGNPLTSRILSPSQALQNNPVQGLTGVPGAAAGSLSNSIDYYYAVTAVSGTQEAVASDTLVQVQPNSGSVNLSWTKSTSPEVTGYNVYRGKSNGSSVDWLLLPNPNPTENFYTDSGPDTTGTSQAPKLDPLSTTFDTAIQNFFSIYETGGPTLALTVTDGTGNGLQYTFNGVSQSAPSWLTTETGFTGNVILFTCSSIANNPNAITPLLPIGTTSFVFNPFFNTNTLNPANPSPPKYNGTPMTFANLSPTGMAFGANGIFADNSQQKVLFNVGANSSLSVNQSAFSTAIGAIEDAVNAALLRGVAANVNSLNWANSPSKLNVASGPGGGTLLDTQIYYYVVTALTGVGETTVSNEVNFQPNNQSTALQWAPVNGATGYRIYRGTVAGQENLLVGTVLGETNSSFNDTQLNVPLPNLTPPSTGTMTSPTGVAAVPVSGGTLAPAKYFYVVTALGITGESMASQEVSATTTSANSSVQMTWTSISTASSYRIYRGTSTGQENVLVGTVPGPGFSSTPVSFTDTGSANQNPAPIKYYAPGTTSDLYAEFFHQTTVSIGGLAYADPFDDQGNQSSTIAASSPTTITVNFPAWTTTATASVSGVLFMDQDSDGQRDPGEVSISGRTLTLDRNGNGFADSGEPSFQTGGDGSYSFSGIVPGSHTLLVNSLGFETPIGANGKGTDLSLAPNGKLTGENLGLRVGSPVGPLPVDPGVFAGSFPDPGTALVQGYYHALLGREGDASGVTYWVGVLGKTSPGTVIQGIINSVEFRSNQVGTYYRVILGRIGSVAEVNSWVVAMNTGLSSTNVATAFLTSTEFTQKTPTNQVYVEKLYQLLLSRNGDGAGVAGWTAALANGALNRSQVVEQFFDSTESRNRALDSVYAQLLERPIDSSGQASFQPLANDGQGLNEVMATILSSQEFTNRRVN